MKPFRSSSIAVIAAAFWTLASCSGGEQPPADRPAEMAAMPDEAPAELARLLDEFDPVAFGNLLTDNARLLPPNIPAVEGARRSSSNTGVPSTSSSTTKSRRSIAR